MFLRLWGLHGLFLHKGCDLNKILILEAGLDYFSTGCLSFRITSSFPTISSVVPKPPGVGGTKNSDRSNNFQEKHREGREGILSARVFTAGLGALIPGLRVGEEHGKTAVGVVLQGH